MRRAIQGTITQLQKSSNNPHSLGRRYATSLRLLWRKSSSKHSAKSGPRNEPAREPPTPAQGGPSRPQEMPAGEKPMEMDPLNGFSWRDLDSLGQYIVNNSTLSMTDSMLTSTEFDWEHSSAGLDDLTTMGPQLDAMWSGHDIIF